MKKILIVLCLFVVMVAGCSTPNEMRQVAYSNHQAAKKIATEGIGAGDDLAVTLVDGTQVSKEYLGKDPLDPRPLTEYEETVQNGKKYLMSRSFVGRQLNIVSSWVGSYANQVTYGLLAGFIGTGGVLAYVMTLLFGRTKALGVATSVIEEVKEGKSTEERQAINNIARTRADDAGIRPLFNRIVKKFKRGK